MDHWRKKWTHPKFSGVVRNVGEKKWFPGKKAATKRDGAGAGPGAQLLKALEGGISQDMWNKPSRNATAFFCTLFAHFLRNIAEI